MQLVSEEIRVAAQSRSDDGFLTEPGLPIIHAEIVIPFRAWVRILLQLGQAPFIFSTKKGPKKIVDITRRSVGYVRTLEYRYILCETSSELAYQLEGTKDCCSTCIAGA